MTVLDTPNEVTTDSRRDGGPQFAVTMRGYDRLQVDDYVDTLRGYLEEAQLRALDAEEELTRLREREATRQAEHDATTGAIAPAGAPAADRPSTEEVVASISATLRAAEELAGRLRAEAEADREQARTLVASAEQEARQRAGDIVEDAQRTVERLARHAELERSRRDNVRRQIAALREALDNIGFPGTGEIDITDEALAGPSEAPTREVVHPAGEQVGANDTTTLLRIPQ